MFKRKTHHLQAVRVDHYSSRRSRSLSFSTLAIATLAGSALLVWGLRNWNQPSSAPQPEIIEPTLQAIAPNAEQQAAQSAGSTAIQTKQPERRIARAGSQLSRAQLRQLLTPYVEQGVYPEEIKSPLNTDQPLQLQYTLDPSLQAWAIKRLSHYNPDYGVFVALDPENGNILALASSQRDQTSTTNLATKATYPAASTIKIITAAAALEEGKATPGTVFAFNGKSTSLYRRQVFNHKNNKWTRNFSLERAFAKSVNPIFGRIGSQDLGGDTLLKYAQQFGFNAQFMSDFEFDNGAIKIDTTDSWQVAESASGYTRRNTLSPIHAATIAASVINGGYLIAPRIVESVTSTKNSQPLYESGEARKLQVLSHESAASMQQLMKATVKVGTGRRTFRRFFKREYKNVIAGGKTGHLSGANPKGSYDWFIGYGTRDNKKIAFAMLCINKDKWYVKSVQFAREALEHYFKSSPQIKAITKNESVS